MEYAEPDSNFRKREKMIIEGETTSDSTWAIHFRLQSTHQHGVGTP